MDWKRSTPDRVFVYFNCNTKLVRTFRRLYACRLKFATNRAIVLHQNDDIPVAELKHWIVLSLIYHKVKNLPRLGA